MTNGGGMPDRRPEASRAKPIPKKPPTVRVPVAKRRVPPPRQFSPEGPPRPAPPEMMSVAEVRQAAPLRPLEQIPIADAPQRSRFRLPTSWFFWAVIGVMVTTGVGGFSVALLLKLPAIPNCPSIFWPTASASLRLYCAEVAANKQTVEDLLEAIALVNGLPRNHALRAEVDRQIEAWSTDILDLSEAAFHQGEIEQAIDTARRIPDNTPAFALVQARIDRWQSIWSGAEGIYNSAEAALKQQDLRQAFTLAVQLLDVDNEYWKTTKYQELNGLIAAYRIDGSKLDRARSLANRGGVQNLVDAVKAVQELKSDSPLYAEAQKLLQELGQDMLKLAMAALDRRDASEAIEIARQIPTQTAIADEVQDLTDLAEAQQQASIGTVADLEAAIIQAQRLRRDRPLYDKAQDLVARWQLEIADVNQLERARQLAQTDTSGNLSAAIAEAQLIPRTNPRGSEAQREIANWTAQVQEMEDRPLLDRAEQIALNGDVGSLQAAISEASQIGEGRTLSAEARRRIRDWTSQIEEMQDQPALVRARQLAASGNLTDAIAVAEQIRSGRALYQEAQGDIRDWRNQTQQQGQLQQAYQAAGGGTANSLVTAIRIANQIPTSSPLRSEAERMMSLWSQSVLQAAQEQAAYDLQGAIATAESIPSDTAAYAPAQQQLQTWRQQLSPAAVPLTLSNPANP